MRIFKRSFLIISVFVICNSLFAQKKGKISQLKISMEDQNLVIEYDILNSNAEDKYNIWLEITDTTGKGIKANTLKGDIGNNIQGGINKKILWDLKKDGFYRNMNLQFEVNAQKVFIPKIEKEPGQIKKDYKTGGILIKSAILPGWGQSVISGNKTYCIVGVTGYLLIGSSVYLNNRAYNNYEEYKKLYAAESDKATGKFNTGEKQYQASNLLGYSAVVIWGGNLIWTVIKLKGDNTNNTGMHSLTPGVLYCNNEMYPGLNIKISF